MFIETIHPAPVAPMNPYIRHLADLRPHTGRDTFQALPVNLTPEEIRTLVREALG